MNMGNVVMESLRNSLETMSTENLIIVRNIQYWSKFLVSYEKYVYPHKIGDLL